MSELQKQELKKLLEDKTAICFAANGDEITMLTVEDALEVAEAEIVKLEQEHKTSLKRIAIKFDEDELDQLYVLEQENRELGNILAGYQLKLERAVAEALKQQEKEFRETFRILSDQPLSDAIREARKKGSKSTEYKFLEEQK